MKHFFLNPRAALCGLTSCAILPSAPCCCAFHPRTDEFVPIWAGPGSVGPCSPPAALRWAQGGRGGAPDDEHGTAAGGREGRTGRRARHRRTALDRPLGAVPKGPGQLLQLCSRHPIRPYTFNLQVEVSEAGPLLDAVADPSVRLAAPHALAHSRVCVCPQACCPAQAALCLGCGSTCPCCRCPHSPGHRSCAAAWRQLQHHRCQPAGRTDRAAGPTPAAHAGPATGRRPCPCGWRRAEHVGAAL